MQKTTEIPEVEDLPDPAGDVYERLVAQQWVTQVRHLVAELPDPDDRRLICMRFGLGPYGKHSLRRAAEQLGMSLRWAWVKEKRALARLRAAYEGYGDGW